MRGKIPGRDRELLLRFLGFLVHERYKHAGVSNVLLYGKFSYEIAADHFSSL